MSLAAAVAGCFVIGLAAAVAALALVRRRHKMRYAMRLVAASLIGIIGIVTAWGYATLTAGLTDFRKGLCFFAMVAGAVLLYRHQRRGDRAVADRLNPLVRRAIDERLGRLKQMTAGELSLLPRLSTERATIDGIELTLARWQHRSGTTDQLAVIQCYLPGILVSPIHVDGFVVTPGGEIRVLTRRELAPYR